MLQSVVESFFYGCCDDYNDNFNRGKDGQGEDVIKPYTPTTLDSDLGRFELVIKVYVYKHFSTWVGF